MKKVICSPKAPKAVGPYSQAILADNTLYVSGQLPVDAETGKFADDVQAQTKQSLTNMGYILEEAGYSFSDVVKTTVLLSDMGDFAAMNEIYAQFYTTDMPARICYQVAKLPLGVKVEIDAIAVK